LKKGEGGGTPWVTGGGGGGNIGWGRGHTSRWVDVTTNDYEKNLDWTGGGGPSNFCL